MNRARALDERIELNMTPMIDVTFQLLIFFVVTMKFRTLEKKLVAHLPTDFGLRGGAAVDESFATLRLRQRRDRPGLRLHEQETEVAVEGEALAGEALAARLAELRRALPEGRAKLDVGPGVPHGAVVGAIDRLRRAGFERIVFSGIPGLASGSEFETHGLRIARDLAGSPR